VSGSSHPSRGRVRVFVPVSVVAEVRGCCPHELRRRAHDYHEDNVIWKGPEPCVIVYPNEQEMAAFQELGVI